MAAGQSVEEERPRAKKVILCLHGYLQNSEVFSSKAGSWRKGLKSRAEFHFVDAPFLVDGDQDVKAAGGAEQGPRRAWWTWQDEGSGMRPSLAHRYSGWQQSLEMLCAKVQELKPDGILGFSQGSTAAALLLAHLSQQQDPLAFKFAILVAGFLPRDQQWADALRGGKADIPLLLIHGEADQLVPMDRSQDLEEALNVGNSKVKRVSHPGAHMMPSCSQSIKVELQHFLDSLNVQ